MPRVYLSPAAFANYPAAVTFPVQVAQLNALSGAMDRLLANASRRCDRYARKRIGAPASTTVATGGISAGGTVLNVNGTLGFDGGDEQAVILNPGGNTRRIPAHWHWQRLQCMPIVRVKWYRVFTRKSRPWAVVAVVTQHQRHLLHLIRRHNSRRPMRPRGTLAF